MTKASVCGLLVALIIPMSLVAQDPLEFPEGEGGAPADDWSFVITPYVLFAAQSTNVGGIALRQSFNDLVSITDAGFQLRALARWRWLSLTLDGTFAELGTQKTLGPIELDLAIDQVILDLKVGGSVYDSRTSAQDGGMAIWVGVGARYSDNQVQIVTERQPLLPSAPLIVDTVSTAQTWWDPVLGVGMQFPVTPAVSFGARATGGGMGIGNASDYLWDYELSALFRVGRRFLVSGGFRHFQYSRTDGEGDEEVTQTVSVLGPQIGFSIGIF